VVAAKKEIPAMTDSRSKLALEEIRRLLDDPNFAQLATVDRTGQPRIDTVWILRRDEKLLVATTRRTRKARNLERDGRAFLVVVNRNDPYEQAQLKVALECVRDDADLVICDEIAHKYLGRPFPARHWPERIVLIFSVVDVGYHRATV